VTLAPASAPEHRFAAVAAAAAGRALLDLRANGGGRGRWWIGAAGDRVANDLLVGMIRRAYPDDPIRSEEGAADAWGDGRLWIIDPLDGTSEFEIPGSAEWAVHVALADGGTPVAGAVAVPALDVVLDTGAPIPLQPAADPPRIAVSRSHPPLAVRRIAQVLGAVPLAMGSAGAKVAAVIRGDAELYVHAGGQYEWDSAAPVAVALAAGLHASRLDGRPLRYGAPDPWLPDLVVCRPELAERVLAAASGGAGRR
jgi:3'(2'), 5'-bisphosphate nucleotidase